MFPPQKWRTVSVTKDWNLILLFTLEKIKTDMKSEAMDIWNIPAKVDSAKGWLPNVAYTRKTIYS